MGKIVIPQATTRAAGPVSAPAAPTVTPAMEGAGLGSGLRELGQGVQDAAALEAKRAEQREVSNMSSFFATTQAQYTKKWQDTLRTADPNDTQVAERFVDDYNKHIDDFRSGITTSAGQDYFERQSAEQGSHFAMTANAAQAQLAGEAAVNNYTNTVKQLSSSLINDPSSFPIAQQMHQTTLDNLVKTGGLPREKAVELSTHFGPELAKSAVRGWIRVDPDMAQQQLDSGKWDGQFNGDTKFQLDGEVKVAKNANFAAEQRRQMEQDRAIKEAQNARQTEYLQKLFVSGNLNVKDIVDDDTLDSFGSGSKQQLINMLLEYNKAGGKIKDDPAVVSDLFDRIHSPETDPRHISDENELNGYFANGIQGSTLNFLRGEIQGRNTPDGKMAADAKKEMIDIAKNVIAGRGNALGLTDPNGGSNYLKFLTNFNAEWEAQRKAGVPVSQLIDPKNKNYMGDRFLSYQKSLPDIMNSQANAFGGKATNTNPFGESVYPQDPNAAPPVNPRVRQPGESVDQYLARRRKEKK